MTLRPDIITVKNYQYASNIRWGISVINMPSGLGISSDELNTRCFSTSIPNYNTEESMIENRGIIVYQPGITKYAGQHTFMFYETEDSAIAKYLNNYKQKSWKDLTGAQEPTKNLKSDFKFSLLTSMDAEREAYNMYGAWVKSWEATELGSSTSEIIKYTVTYQYDYFIKVS